ncbi:unnamed protein product [Clonostachys rosea]|uniref:Uncharacterized protein n=1 Tax=Bionectria ochroleuca TaxID=29856 RepID=A0ABY6UI08_BIOOC|nr:unnamed protein product [Clonostachys rosea]
MSSERGTLIPEWFHLQDVTTTDLVLASLAWGFTLGMGWITTWTAIQQTLSAYRRLGWTMIHNAYIWMVWGEIVASLCFGILTYLHLFGIIKPSFEFYFCILTLWVMQVQFLLQIIINRSAILLTDRKFLFRIKYGTVLIIGLINISVYCIWIPARLQISPTWIHINEIWDRCEKAIYLIVDGGLNLLFIKIVKQNLIELGLHKYNGLVRFNIFIIGFSLGMDVLIIAMMSLPNTFVYMQFHPLAYIVKLNIEMSMASLIAKLARTSEPGGTSDYSHTHSRSHGPRTERGNNTRAPAPEPEPEWPKVTTTIEMNTMDAPMADDKSAKGHFKDTDTLIDQGAPYSVRVETRKVRNQTTTVVSPRGEGSSISSRGSSEVHKPHQQ